MTELRVPPRDNRSPDVARRPSAWSTVLRIHRTLLMATVLGAAGLAGILAVLRHLVARALDGAPLDQVCPGWVEPCVQNGLWWWEQGQTLPVLTIALLALPALSGVLLGASMSARDAEQGTDILLHTQGVTAIRWWSAQLVLVAVPVAVVFVGLGAVARSTFDVAFALMTEPMKTPGFEVTGPVLGGYFLLAYGLASAVGVWTRNTPTAITVGLVGSVAIVLALGVWLRPHYQEPLKATVPILEAAGGTGLRPFPLDWIIDDVYVGPQGQTLTAGEITCEATPLADWERCLREQVVEQRFVWQPADRWLRFQLTEFVLVTVLGAAAALLGRWRYRRSTR